MELKKDGSGRPSRSTQLRLLFQSDLKWIVLTCLVRSMAWKSIVMTMKNFAMRHGVQLIQVKAYGFTKKSPRVSKYVDSHLAQASKTGHSLRKCNSYLAQIVPSQSQSLYQLELGDRSSANQSTLGILMRPSIINSPSQSNCTIWMAHQHLKGSGSSTNMTTEV